ncbi:hypothetical protein HPB50_021798 [Hyalomma asiaticum]|uniref:Uncharacterized protein n=1 Tax=Hyalomma asiaticum TaxID=266040 RepID=A0ACB7RS70_HYAAI|nr:hypothetical protein HPB50_021798 [Hyalomma asiaticum]
MSFERRSKKLFVIAAVILLSVASVRKHYERPHVCPRRIGSLDGPGPGKEWHIGGWAIRRLCSQPLDTLFFVHTAPAHWERRIHHRDTVFEDAAREAFNWTGVFFMGEHEDPLVNLWTKLEAEATGDVVIFPYNDTFHTILYKLVFGMRWVTEHCPNVRNIVKIDDEVGVQPFELRRYLDEKLPLKNTSIHGLVWKGSKVVRDPRDKYCVPEDEVILDNYPPYCSGRSIIMTMDTMEKLYRASKIVKAYAIDDTYLSGDLALFTNTGHEDIASWISWNSSDVNTERLLQGKAIFTHELLAYENSLGRRAQWGQMIWSQMMQHRSRRAFNFSYRLDDRAYRNDFREIRRALATARVT